MTARATVVDAKGQPVPNTIVTFSVGGSLTTITPSAGTALTNASGVATVTITPKDLLTAQQQAGAADTVTAVATVNGATVDPVKQSFRLGATSITLSLAAPAGGSISLNAYDTTPIKVNVLANGSLYTAQPVSVSFSSACQGTKATLPSSATTFNGQAQVVYADNGCGGTDTVTASVQGAPSVTAALNIAAPVAASVKFVSATPSDKSIVIKGAGGNGRSETAILTFQALDTFGKPLPNQLVNFSVNSTNPVTLQSTSATTGTDGTVTVAVNSGTLPTTFRVSATLPSGQTTISDTVTVTTGQPVQAAVSLSTTSYNLEGWAYDNTQAMVTILLADQSGNPVADGTPVVFQADSGAVGTSAIGGCLTTNGGCNVTFRSQNPRYAVGNSAGKRAGLATINASTTSSAVTLTGQIGIFLSGSYAANAYLSPSGTAFTSGSTFSNGSSCGTKYLVIEFDDLNNNPLPSGTTIAIANTTNLTAGTVLPGTVPSIGPHPLTSSGSIDVSSLAATQGSTHVFPLTPPATCNTAGTVDAGSGTFDIVITTPKGNISTFNGITIRFPQ
jgi:protocatechuate 3,4-dioxygenase beta subunit